MKDEIKGHFPAGLALLIEQALERQVYRRWCVEAWAQNKIDRQPPTERDNG